MSMKNPLTVGIEPATFRFVAQHLNHCATAVPYYYYYYYYYSITWVGLGLFNNSSPLLSVLELRLPTNNFQP